MKGETNYKRDLTNAVEGTYQLSHLYDQLLQRASSDDDNRNCLRKHPDRMCNVNAENSCVDFSRELSIHHTSQLPKASLFIVEKNNLYGYFRFFYALCKKEDETTCSTTIWFYQWAILGHRPCWIIYHQEGLWLRIFQWKSNCSFFLFIHCYLTNVLWICALGGMLLAAQLQSAAYVILLVCELWSFTFHIKGSVFCSPCSIFCSCMMHG